jgi:hypothetical protein
MSRDGLAEESPMADEQRRGRRGLRVVHRESENPDDELVELTVRVTLGLRRQLRVAAAEEDLTMSEFVTQAIRERMNVRRRPRGGN